MERETLIERVRSLGPWFQQIDLGEGVRTRDIAPSPGPQPLNHPVQRWEKLRRAVPEDLSGMQILDVGCSDGFFSVELARRGAADIVATDRSPACIERISFVLDHLGIDVVRPTLLDVYDVGKALRRFDMVFMLAVLYHLSDPLRGLQEVAKVTDTLYIETLANPNDEVPALIFKRVDPQVNPLAKWIPTTRCLREMLLHVGFDDLTEVADASDGRPIILARRTRQG